MNAGRTARAIARAHLTGQIKDAARQQLATTGAQGLSLRAVARELGMVSSALYRYFSCRDALLTALIVDAYDSLGEQVEKAAAADAPAAERWHTACRAARDWARAHPHEYALIYGTPVPDYRAPADTIQAGGRAALALLAIVADAYAAGDVPVHVPGEPALPDGLTAQLDAVTADLDTGLPAPVLARMLMAWTQVFGMISFELFGQFANTLDDATAFYDHATTHLAAFIGLGRPAR